METTDNRIIQRIEAELLIPGRGDVIPNGTVVIQAGKILYAGPDISAPETVGAEVFRVKTVMPGMWDTHVHFVGLPDKPKGDMFDCLVKIPEQQRVIRATKHAEKALMAGFTSVREVGGLGEHLAPLIADGTIVGPTVYYAGDILSMTGGHGDMHSYKLECLAGMGSKLGQLCDGVPDALKAVRLQLRRGAHCIKICASGGVMSELDHPCHQQFSDEELRAIVEEAGRAERVVAAHCHGVAGISAALRAGCRTIEHGSYLDETAAQEMLRQDAVLVPTMWITERLFSTEEPPPGLGVAPHAYAKGRALYQRHREAVALAISTGVRIALGTDMFVSSGWGTNGKELELMCGMGMTPLQAIECATANGPLTLGPQAPRSGQLCEGFDADIIAVDGDPLQDISLLGNSDAVHYVWKGGALFKSPGTTTTTIAGGGGAAVEAGRSS